MIIYNEWIFRSPWVLCEFFIDHGTKSEDIQKYLEEHHHLPSAKSKLVVNSIQKSQISAFNDRWTKSNRSKERFFNKNSTAVVGLTFISAFWRSKLNKLFWSHLKYIIHEEGYPLESAKSKFSGGNIRKCKKNVGQSELTGVALLTLALVATAAPVSLSR